MLNKKTINKFATYFKSLKTKLNIIENIKRNKFFYDLNNILRKIIIFDIISSTIRQKILIKIVNAKQLSFYQKFSKRFRFLQIFSFDDRERQKNKKSFKFFFCAIR